MDYEKQKKAMESLRDTEAYPYLKEFLECEIKRTLNTLKTTNSEEALKCVGEYKALDKVLTFVGGN